MLFNYKTTTPGGLEQVGSIDAPNADMAISSLQKRGLVVINVSPVAQKKQGITFFNRIKTEDIVLMSRQVATLFEAKVSVLETFRLMANEADNPLVRTHLTEVTDDIKSGISISDAMAKHPELFSTFYISMVRSGEESGKLSETFNFLADYLDRSYALVSKARNALIYPAFVILSFVIVMIIMVTFVIPKLGSILQDTGQQLPIYTTIILDFSNFVSTYWYIFVALAAALAVFLYKYLPTAGGRDSVSRFKLSVPYVGDLYKKLYLSRIADNLDTMISSGVSMVRALEVTADVVDNNVYHDILLKASASIKAGGQLSDILAGYEEIPGIMVQMMKVGEESGKLGYVLKTMAKFYEREVDNAVDTLVGLIEPVMIVVLGVGVGFLLTAVLLPIYNVAGSM